MNVLETVPSQNSVTPHNAFLQSRNRDSSSFMLENFFFVSLAIWPFLLEQPSKIMLFVTFLTVPKMGTVFKIP